VTASPGDTRRSLLIVEDDDAYRERLARALGDRGLEVTAVESAARARTAAEAESPEFALVDLRLPDGSGIEVVRALHAIDPTTRIVVLTGYGSIATALDAVRLGAAHYLTKPADVDEILAAFERGEAVPAASGATPEPPAPASLARVEWEHISRVLSDCGGNISKAARVLGIHRRSLQRKLTKYPPAR
jgi:two-component system response regulator RegA